MPGHRSRGTAARVGPPRSGTCSWLWRAGAAARDNTAYSPNPKNTRNFLTHHTQRQALAATRANAKHMLIEADALKAYALLYHTSGAARTNPAPSATI